MPPCKRQNDCAHYPDCFHSCGKILFNISNPLSFVLFHYIWIMHAKKISNEMSSKIESGNMALLTIKRIKFNICMRSIQS